MQLQHLDINLLLYLLWWHFEQSELWENNLTHSDNDYSSHGDGCILDQQFSRDERGATITKV